MFVMEAVLMGFLGGVVGLSIGFLGGEVFNIGLNLLATRFGSSAVEMIMQGKFGEMVCLKDGLTNSIPLSEVAGKLNLVPQNHYLIRKGGKMGVCFGNK